MQLGNSCWVYPGIQGPKMFRKSGVKDGTATGQGKQLSGISFSKGVKKEEHQASVTVQQLNG